MPFEAKFEGLLNHNLSFWAQFEGVYDRQEGRRMRRPYTIVVQSSIQDQPSETAFYARWVPPSFRS